MKTVLNSLVGAYISEEFMIKEFTATGRSLEEAMSAAKLGLHAPDDALVHTEIVEQKKKKFFGLFGSSEVTVKASYDDGRKQKKQKQNKPAKKEAPKKNAPKKDAPRREQPAKKAEKPAARKSAPKPEAASEEKEEVKITEADVDIKAAETYLGEMIKGLKVEDAQITGAVVDGVLEITIECDDYGIIIGHRGETLDSLQYLTSLQVKKASGKYVRVTLNVGNYREKRAETLRNLARKNANYVIRTGRRYTFEPMNPYERRIIHTAVQEIGGVESMSIGYGQDRKVVIQPIGGAKPQQRGGNRGGRGGASRPAAKPIQKDFTKFGKIEVNTAPAQETEQTTEE